MVELARVQGDGIEEIRLVQLSTPLANSGELLDVHWDDDFAISLIGLSEQVDSEIAGSLSRHPSIRVPYGGPTRCGHRRAHAAVPGDRAEAGA